MLKRIVEDYGIHALGNRFAYSATAVGRGDYRNTLIQPTVHDCLVASIATEYDSRPHAFRGESLRTPCSDGRLTGTSDGQVSNAKNRDRKVLHRENAPLV